MNIKHTLLLPILGFGLTAGCAHAQAQTVPAKTDPSQLSTLVKTLKEKSGARAVLFGMWEGDREILTAALGDSMTSTPATTDMHYRIGGISETFLSTLLLRLVDQKLINLNDKLSKWYPALLAADQVTLRMLINNTAGYKDYVYDPAFIKLALDEPFREFSADEIIKYAVKDGQMNFPPGTSQKYSHTEYVIIGEVMEKATGKSMTQLYQEQIFTPLGLKDTQVHTTPELQTPVLHAFSSDRGVYEDSTFWNPSWTSHTGGLNSNLKDIGRWGPAFGSGSLLSPESFQEQTGPATVGLGNNKPELYFAYGFVVANGWYVQNPNFGGFKGAFAYLPSKKITIVIESTQSPGGDSSKNEAFQILQEVIQFVTPEVPLKL